MNKEEEIEILSIDENQEELRIHLGKMRKLHNDYCKLKREKEELRSWLEEHWEQSQDIWFVKIINKMKELERDDYE